MILKFILWIALLSLSTSCVCIVGSMLSLEFPLYGKRRLFDKIGMVSFCIFILITISLVLWWAATHINTYGPLQNS